MTHTNGPWYVVPKSFFVVDKRVWYDENGARCGETPNFVIDCPNESVANLVAAAPELLAALKNAENYMSSFEGDEMQEGIDDRLRVVRAAIAKVEGR